MSHDNPHISTVGHIQDIGVGCHCATEVVEKTNYQQELLREVQQNFHTPTNKPQQYERILRILQTGGMDNQQANHALIAIREVLES